MDDLVTWLRACLDDEERAAQAAGAGVWTYERDRLLVWAGDVPVYYEFGHDPDQVEQAEHIARQDPVATLARVDAHRLIVDRCAEVLAEFDRKDTWGAWPEFGPKRFAEDVLAALGLAYAHLPGYQEAWKP